jgi:hypothetical protein
MALIRRCESSCAASWCFDDGGSTDHQAAPGGVVRRWRELSEEPDQAGVPDGPPARLLGVPPIAGRRRFEAGEAMSGPACGPRIPGGPPSSALQPVSAPRVLYP